MHVITLQTFLPVWAKRMDWTLQQEIAVSKFAYPLFPNVNSDFALWFEHSDDAQERDSGISTPRWLQ